MSAAFVNLLCSIFPSVLFKKNILIVLMQWHIYYSPFHSLCWSWLPMGSFELIKTTIPFVRNHNPTFTLTMGTHSHVASTWVTRAHQSKSMTWVPLEFSLSQLQRHRSDKKKKKTAPLISHYVFWRGKWKILLKRKGISFLHSEQKFSEHVPGQVKNEKEND